MRANANNSSLKTFQISNAYFELTTVALLQRIKKAPLKYSHFFADFDEFTSIFSDSKNTTARSLSCNILRVI